MDPRPRPRAGIYARSRREDALDLPMQARVLESFAAQKGWEIALVEQEGAAGTARRLPARARLLEAVRRGEVEVVAAWKLDRIAGSLTELVSFLDELRVHGAALATLADDFDFTGEQGEELMRVVRSLATFQRLAHRDQVRSGLARAATVGRPSSAGAHRDEALALAAEGLSQREIARRLGLHPKTIARLLKRNG